MLTTSEIESRWYREHYGRVIRSREDLHKYQNRAIKFLYDTPFSALFIDVGMGKSVICLTLLADLLLEGWNGKALVIAPLNVAKATWPQEISEWKQAAGIDYQLIRAEDEDDEVKEAYQRIYKHWYERNRSVGERPKDAARFASEKARPIRRLIKESRRREQARSQATVHIINIEQVEWLVNFWEEEGRRTGNRWPYDVVIIDESSKFKDYTTKRYKAFKKTLSRLTRLHTLTASPAAEGYQHLFAQIFLLDRGERFGRYITHYLEKYFHHIKKAHKWVIKEGSEEKISKKISDICLVMKAKDYKEELGIEEWLPIRRPIKLNRDLMQRYKDFEKTFILKLDDMLIEAVNSAALFNKLLQMTSGAVYDEERNVIPVHNEKIESLHELVEELQGEPLLVGYWFKSSLTRLRQAFPKAPVLTRSNVIRLRDQWNGGELPMMLIQPGSAAHGLNLQKGPGHDASLFDPIWSRELYEQLIGRLARQGQKNVVRVHHLMCVDTADEVVYDCLEDKGAGQDRLFEYIRAARARYLEDRRG